MRTILLAVVIIVETLTLGVVVLTVGLVLPRRWCFDPLFHIWSQAILTAAGVRLTIEGRQHVARHPAYFFVGNHQSLFDIPVLACATRGRVRFMAKQSLYRIPFFGWILKRHGFIPIDRSSARRAKQTIDAMLAQLRERPTSIVLFPEGTRTMDGQLGPFKRGAIQVCQRSAMPILPFSLDGTLAVHQRGSWRIQPQRVRVSFAEPIAAEEAGEMTADDLLTRLESQVSEMLFNRPGFDREPPAQTQPIACEGQA